jgi:hypothetical protein
MSTDVIIGYDGKPRCRWAGHGDTGLGRYHDQVWGTRKRAPPFQVLQSIRLDVGYGSWVHP